MKTVLTLSAALVLLSGAAQTTWYEVPTGTDKKLNAINFPTSSVGYIVGDDSLLLKTTDGGYTWSELNFSGIDFFSGGDDMLAVDFISATTGYIIVGPYAGAYKTIDGGANWTQVVPAGNLCFYGGLYFFDAQNGFVGGSGCFQGELIEKMNSGMMQETTINASTNDASNRVVDIDFLGNDFGLAVSISGYVFRTTDGGATWDSIPTGLNPGIPLTSVAIMNDTLAYAGYNDLGSGFGILRTTDGGLSWAQDISSATFYYPAWLSAHKATSGTFFAGAQPSLGTSGLIFESAAADTWMFYEVDHPVNGISSYGDSVVFAVGDSGLVVVNVPPANLNVPESLTEMPHLNLYPNPVVNDELTIELPFGKAVYGYEIVIRSISGDVVFRTIDSKQTTFDISALTPGIYLVDLYTSAGCYTARFVRQ